MTPLQWIQVIATLASAFTAALVWAMRPAPAGKDLLAAKDAELAALHRELEALRQLAPLKIREFFLHARGQLKDYCGRLQEIVDAAKRERASCEAQLNKLQGAGAFDADQARPLIQRRDQLVELLAAMKGGLRELQHQCEYPDNMIVKFPSVDPATILALTDLALPRAADGEALRGLTATLAETFKYHLDENTLFSNVPFARPGQRGERAEVWQRPDNGE